MPDIQSSPYNYNNELQDTGVVQAPPMPQTEGEATNSAPIAPKIPSIFSILDSAEAIDHPWIKSEKYNDPINTKLSETERYADPKFGFNPLNPNLENQYGDRESWFTRVGHDVVKIGANTLGSFAQTIATIPNAINAAVSGDFSKMENNPINNGVSDFLEGLETSMPDFTSTWEQSHPVLNYIPFVGNGWGGVMKNVGFVAGAIGASILQDAAVGVLTGGIGDVPLVGMQLANIGAKLGKIMSGGSKAFKGLNEAFLAGNKAEEALTTAYDLAKVGDKLRYGLAIQTGAWSQAAMMANNVHRELRNQLQQDYYNTHGYDASGADNIKVEDFARRGANSDMLATAALLTVTDAIQFPSLLKPFAAAKRAVEATLEGDIKIGLKEGSKDVFEEVVNPSKGIKGFINNKVLTPSRLLASTGVESAKMGGQIFFQRSAQDFYKRKFNDDAVTDTDNLSQSIGEGLQHVFFTPEGREGLIMGGLIGVAIHGLRSAAERLRGVNSSKSQIVDTTLELLNQDKLTGTIENHYDEAATSVSIQKDMQNALKSGDLFEFKNLQHQQLFNFVKSGVEANRFDARIEQLKLLKELSPQEFKAMFQMDFNDGTRATASEYVDALISKARDIKKTVEKVNRVFTNPYKLNSNDPREQEKHKGFESLKTQLALDISEVGDNRRRIEKLHQEIQEVAPGIDSNKLVNLTSEEGVRQTIKDFKERIKDIEKNKSIGVHDRKETQEKQFLENKIESFESDLIDFQPARYMRVLHDTVNYLSGRENFTNTIKESVIDPIDLASVHQKASDIYKLGVNSERATQNYNRLTSKEGFDSHMDDYIKHLLASADNLAVNENGEIVDKRTLPTNEQPVQLDDQMNPIVPAKATPIAATLSAEETKELSDLKAQATNFTKPVNPNPQINEFLTNLTNKEGLDAFKGTKEYIQNELKLDPATATLKEIKDAVQAQAEKPTTTPVLTLEQAERLRQLEAKEAELNEALRNAKSPTTPIPGAEMLSGTKADAALVPPTGKAKKPGGPEKPEKVKPIFAAFNPQAFFYKLNSKSYPNSQPYETNVENAIFKNSAEHVRNNASIVFTEHGRPDYGGYAPVTDIKGFYRKNNPFDATLMVDGKALGKLSPSDTIFYKRGHEYVSVLDMTPKEYADTTGNSVESFDTFKKHYLAYHDAYSRMVEEYKAGKKEFDAKDIERFFEVLPRYGKAKYVDNDTEATLIKDLNYRQPGDVILSVPTIFDEKTGTYDRTSEPTIIDEENLGENWMAVQHAIYDNLDTIRKLNSRYILLRQFPDGTYKAQGVLAARPRNIAEGEMTKFLSLISSFPDSLTPGETSRANKYLRDTIYIADSENEKGGQTNIALQVNEKGEVVLKVYNKRRLVSAVIPIVRENLRNVKEPSDLTLILNDAITKAKAKNDGLSKLKVKIKTTDFKSNIEPDENSNMASLEDKLTVPTRPMSFEQFHIRLQPKDVEVNDEETRESKNVTMSTRGVREFSKTRLIGLVKGVYNRLFPTEKLTDVQERRLASMELPLDTNEKLNYKELAKVLNAGENSKVSEATAAKIADMIGKVKSNPQATAAARPKELTPAEHKVMDAVETSTLPLAVKEKVEANPKAAIQQIKKEVEAPKAPIIPVPEAVKTALKEVKPEAPTGEDRPPKEGDKIAFFANPEDAKKKYAKKIEFHFRTPDVVVKESSVKDKYNVVVDGKVMKTLDAKGAEEEADKLKLTPDWYYKNSNNKGAGENWEKLKGKDLKTAQEKWDELNGVKKDTPIVEETPVAVTPTIEETSTETPILSAEPVQAHIEVAQLPLWMKPIAPKSPELYAHMSDIQKAEKAGFYDAALKEGKITENQLRDIFLSMKQPQYDERGVLIEDDGKNVYGAIADKIIFRVSHPELISDVDYWKSLVPKDGADYETYLSALREADRNGNMSNAIKSGALSVEDAERIYDHTGKKLLHVVKDIKEAKDAQKVEKTLEKVVEKKAEKEAEIVDQKLAEVDERPSAAPIAPQAEGIDVLKPKVPKEEAPKEVKFSWDNLKEQPTEVLQARLDDVNMDLLGADKIEAADLKAKKNGIEKILKERNIPFETVEELKVDVPLKEQPIKVLENKLQDLGDKFLEHTNPDETLPLANQIEEINTIINERKQQPESTTNDKGTIRTSDTGARRVAVKTEPVRKESGSKEENPVAKTEGEPKSEKKKSISEKTKNSANKLINDYENDDLTTTQAAEKARKLFETNEQGIKDHLPSVYKQLVALIEKADNMTGNRVKKKLGIEDLPKAVDAKKIGDTVVYQGESFEIQDIIEGKDATYYDLGDDLIINSNDTQQIKDAEIASDNSFASLNKNLNYGTEQEVLQRLEYEQTHANGEDLSEEIPKENDTMLTYTGLQTILNRLEKKFGIKYRIITDEGMKERGRFVNGEVLINMDKFTKDTPFHEYMHPFIAALKVDNVDLYNKLHSLLAEDPEGQNELRRAEKYYKDVSEQDQKDEALVSYLGKAMADGYTKEGLRSKSKYWTAITDLITKFRLWLKDLLWWEGKGMKLQDFSDESTYRPAVGKGEKIVLYTQNFIEQMTLKDFSDFVAQSDIRFDLSDSMDVINKLDKAQKDVQDEKTEDGKILARVERKLRVLRETGAKRLNSPELQAEAEAVDRILSTAEIDEALSVNSYVKQGVEALKFANSEIKDIQRLFHLAEFKPSDVTALTKRLNVARELTEFYNRDVNHLLKRITQIPESKGKGSIKGKMEALETAKRMQDIVTTNNDKVNQLHDITASLLTEWLYPYIEQAQNGLDAKYDKFKLSKGDFKNKLLSADADPSTINYWLSSIGSMKDPVNAIVKTAMIDVFKRNSEDSSKINLETQDEYRKFLLRNNLKNDRKENSEWNEKNYLRKASNWEKIGEDKEGKPEYGYVERKAFHEEFLWDQWHKDRRTFIESLGERPDGGDKVALEAWTNKIFAWEDANSQKRKTGEKAEIMNRVRDAAGNVTETPSGTFSEIEEIIPSDKYRNAEWDRLKNDPFYQKIYNLYKEANARVSENKLEHGIIPQVSKGKNSWSDLKWNKGFKENAKIIGNKISEKFGGKDDVFTVKTEEGEVNFGNNDVNLDGSVYRNIKHPYTRLLDDADVDTVLVESVLKYHHAATIYDNLKMAEPNIKALQDFVNGNGLGMKGRGVKLTTTKGGVILDKVLGLPQQKEKQLTRLNNQLNGFINDVVYGEGEFKDNLQLGNYTLSLNKLGSNLGLLTALNNMAFNIGGGIANVAIGNIQSLQEGFGGKYYTKKHWVEAKGEYWKAVASGDILADITNVKKSPTTQLAIMYDAIQGEFREKYGKNIVGSVAQRYANLDSIFFVNHAGEHEIQTTFMLAMMRGQKVKLTGGGETNLRDAYQLNKDGYMRLRPDAIWTDADKAAFTSRLHSKNYELNGNYSAFDKAMIQRKWYGKMALIYRKYLYNAFRARYSNSRMDYELRDVIRGNYNTFFSKLAQDLRDYKLEGVKRAFTREGWNEEEKYAYNKTVFELSALLGVSVLGMAIAHGADKKSDPYVMRQLYLRLLNLRSDLRQYSIMAIPDMINIAKNPSVILGTISKYSDFILQLGHPLETYQKKTGIFAKGDSKLAAKFLKAFPGVRQIVNIMQPEEQAKFYQMTSGGK